MIRICSRRKHHGFSLIEMLAVMIIIGILIAAASVLVLPRPTPRQAAEIIGAAIEQVRMESMATGRSTALLILSDPSEPERFRKIQSVRRTTLEGGEAVWEVTGPSLELGRGILFKESDSTADADGSALAKMTLPLRGGPEGEGLEWISFGFTAEGTPLQPTARLVFGRGTDDEFDSPQEDSAFIVSTSGRPTPAFDFANLAE